ncbi:PHP domain-containing protein [Demequina sp. TTPB684]|uniref:PHP domain-containing protein n=1 Tax=unclassified Demequina TaxID=2620311 RepID=UPI001CF0EE2C|nr:PHP domain-containing protein [Demequina sp. TMPB413]MCB2412334.1 PHP domain-containing protein [Demequina sp. TTPB684]UPU88513.1 PHP domain-containing protein [Demequina sp. TMPB413]
MRIDLHTHSHVSDGTESPSEVMRAAQEAGLDVVALTDHDSMAGLEEAADMAGALGLNFVPGIEVSCTHHGVSIHLLAYWPDPSHRDIIAMLERTRIARIARAQDMVRLIAAVYPLTWDDVVEHAGSADTVGRPHIADALVARGAFATRDDAFAEVLAGNSAFYVPHYAPDVLDAIRTLRGTGAVPVFAHPGADGRGQVVPTTVIEQMTRAGLAGLEVEHRDHSEVQRGRLARIAQRLDLVHTGASDYHGTGKLNRLGENVTSQAAYEALQTLRG